MGKTRIPTLLEVYGMEDEASGIGTGKQKDQTGADAASQFLAQKASGQKPMISKPGVPKPTTGAPPSSKQSIWQATQDILKGKAGDNTIDQLAGAQQARFDNAAVSDAEKARDKERKQAIKDLQASKQSASTAQWGKPGSAKPIPGAKSSAPVSPLSPDVPKKIDQTVKQKMAATPADRFGAWSRFMDPNDPRLKNTK